MAEYKRNKLRTAFDIVSRIENWPTAWDMRINPSRQGLRLLRFRNGMNLLCRGGTRDWDVIHELFFAQSYGRAFQYLSSVAQPSVVIDLGANIGAFSLLAAQTNSLAAVHVFEPGSPNLRLLEMNCLANPAMSRRIHIHSEAVAGTTQSAKWFFDQDNPGGSSLFGQGDSATDIQIRAFAEVLETLPDSISLVKVDIEGAEYEMLEQTPPKCWARIPAIALELHEDPRAKMSNEEFLNKMHEFGYKIQPERVCSFFLIR